MNRYFLATVVLIQLPERNESTMWYAKAKLSSCTQLRINNLQFFLTKPLNMKKNVSGTERVNWVLESKGAQDGKD
jgi:hypothetical protein